MLDTTQTHSRFNSESFKKQKKWTVANSLSHPSNYTTQLQARLKKKKGFLNKTQAGSDAIKQTG